VHELYLPDACACLFHGDRFGSFMEMQDAHAMGDRAGGHQHGPYARIPEKGDCVHQRPDTPDVGDIFFGSKYPASDLNDKGGKF